MRNQEVHGRLHQGQRSCGDVPLKRPELQPIGHGLCQVQKSAAYTLPLLLRQRVKLINPLLPECDDPNSFLGSGAPDLALRADLFPKVCAILLG